MVAARLEDAPAAAFGVLHAYAENRCPELSERIDALAGRGRAALSRGSRLRTRGAGRHLR